MFAELLRILEKRGAIGLKGRPSALRSITIGPSQDVGDCLLGARRVVFGEPRLVAFEQPLQDSDGGGEVVADGVWPLSLRVWLAMPVMPWFL